MPVFSYTAIDNDAQRVRGVIRADTTRQARMQLLRQGVRATNLRQSEDAPQVSHKRTLAPLIARLVALRQRDTVVEVLENLLTLLESHVPLEEAWQSLNHGKHRRGFWKHSDEIPPVLQQLHEGARSGRAMWSVMEEYPAHFDAVDVALVRAGEEAGELPEALGRMLTRRQLAGRLLSTFLGALAYPMFLCVFGSIVVVFLSSVVLPNLNGMLVAAGGKIPWPTLALIGLSRIISWGLLPLGCLALLAIILGGQRNSRLRKLAAAQVLRVPVIGRAWHHWQLAQFCLVLRTLVVSGIQLPTALILAGHSAGEGPVLEAAKALKEQLMEGRDLDGGWGARQGWQHTGEPDKEGPPEQCSGFPLWLWRALAVGQAAGNLDSVLERVGKRFEHAATKSAAKLAAVIEPLMILVMGLIIGLVAYAALLPIIRLGGAL